MVIPKEIKNRISLLRVFGVFISDNEVSKQLNELFLIEQHKPKYDDDNNFWFEKRATVNWFLKNNSIVDALRERILGKNNNKR